MKIFHKISKAALLAALFLSVIGCTPKPEQLEFAGPTMGTTWSVKVVLDADNEKIDAPLVQADLEKALVDFNQVASTYINDSEISRFNQHESSEPFAVSEELGYLVAASKVVHQKSQGYFDVSLGPLIRLWGFGNKIFDEDRIPSSEAIAQAKQSMGSDKLNVIINHAQGTAALIKSEGIIKIDLSAIAKGRGVDVLAEYIESLGV